MTQIPTKSDPILVAVIGNALDGITREIGQTMLRTSRSPIFVEARDFATSIFGADCQLVAQTHYIPVIGGATPFAQRAIAEFFGDDIHDGDVFIHNDPFNGGSHLPDITITRPVFFDGELVFWAMTKGHNADVGGGGVVGFNPGARDVQEEGVRIPPVRIIDRGTLRKDAWELILSNVRMRSLVESVLNCQIGATAIGERRLHALLKKYGTQTVRAATDELMRASARQVRAEIATIPDGEYSAETLIDNDGIDRDRPYRVAVTIKVDGEKLTFDFSASDPQAQGFINSPIANTVASAHLALFGSIDPDIRYNSGAIEPLEIVAPKGSIVNPDAPAPVAACTVPTCEAIAATVWMAMAKAVPSRAHAGWARWCTPATMGMNPRTGRAFGDLHFLGKGGSGATEGFDGWDHLSPANTLGGLRTPDPELHELDTPYLLEELEYLPDSAGGGQWRGGLGVRYRWRVQANDIACATYGSGFRPETAPVGLLGGQPGIVQTLTLTRPGAEPEQIDTNSFYTLNEGDVFEVVASGGGGFGDPHLRDAELVLRDVREGVVSLDAARAVYGVDIDPDTFEIRGAETATLRAGTR
ncbi:hydantoinase B/oxoprolinase family protein [Skermania sp. ID1734]|uniref:hydantoinase B/oxoprolinase family protein n=1 Tax=Skermania sp. ID1734 TaxID=2597516 RepID=UPI00117D5014|nr:hydantoinase B/oxoprolinase family protein [Skermania sp. ID1734]TSD98071.1 hydantoinase B/oxoprolinase family protein [Skermania sp. ID1734]